MDPITLHNVKKLIILHTVLHYTPLPHRKIVIIQNRDSCIKFPSSGRKAASSMLLRSLKTNHNLINFF